PLSRHAGRRARVRRAGTAASPAGQLPGAVGGNRRGRSDRRRGPGGRSVNAPARLLPPTLLAALGNLPLVARTVVEGALTGLHRSPRFGFSQEFAEYRAYVPGDDLRFVDWNVFARTDRTYVKRYFGETNTRVMVLLDTSASMGIEPSSGAIRKLDFARFLTAAL